MIGSTFYPSFHAVLFLLCVASLNLCDDAHPSWRARSPLHEPCCRRANQYKLHTCPMAPFNTISTCFPEGRKKTTPPPPDYHHATPAHPEASPSNEPAVSSQPPLSLSSCEMDCPEADAHKSVSSTHYDEAPSTILQQAALAKAYYPAR